MEVSVTVEESIVCLITSAAKKDMGTVLAEALEQWMKRNLPKCPVDETYCKLNEPCNNCSKIKSK
jgi:hypothetical protein